MAPWAQVQINLWFLKWFPGAHTNGQKEDSRMAGMCAVQESED